MKKVDYVLGFQGIYYFVTSVWPLVHLRSFEAVVGEKPDKFQLFTTSLLILVISLSILSSIGKEKTGALKILSIGAPIVFIAVEVFYRNSIRPVFFADALLELLVFILLGYFYLRDKKSLN